MRIYKSSTKSRTRISRNTTHHTKMLSTYIRWPFIRQVRILNTSICGQGKACRGCVDEQNGCKVIPARRSFHKTTLKNNNKMLHSFEDCVFQTFDGPNSGVNGKLISSNRVYQDNNNKVATNLQLNEECLNKQGVVQQEENSNSIDLREQQQILREYEVSIWK